MKKPFVSITYIITLLIVLMVPLTFIQKLHSTWVMVLLYVGLGIVHFVCYIGIGLYFEERMDRTFRKVYKKIYENYKNTKQADVFYDELVNIKKKAKTRACKNAYYLSLSTAAYETNRGKEALSLLDKINVVDDKKLQEAIQKQRTMIYNKYQIKTM